MQKVKSLKKNPSWFGNMIKLSWIITGIADSLLPSIIWTNPAISNHNKHHCAQRLSVVLLTLSANQNMLSVFSLGFDSICLECESTSWALLFHIHAEAQWHLVLCFPKGPNSADRQPLRPRCKVNSLHLCDIRLPQYAVLWEQAITEACQRPRPWPRQPKNPGRTNDKGDFWEEKKKETTTC